MLGTANFRAGPVLAFLSGNLCYQIEHHLFPDLPSNRYAQIAPRVRAVCASYGLPYTSGPLARQYLLTLRTIFTLALPDRIPGQNPRSPRGRRLTRWSRHRRARLDRDQAGEGQAQGVQIG
jgi:fatty acid desaturase